MVSEYRGQVQLENEGCGRETERGGGYIERKMLRENNLFLMSNFGEEGVINRFEENLPVKINMP